MLYISWSMIQFHVNSVFSSCSIGSYWFIAAYSGELDPQFCSYRASMRRNTKLLYMCASKLMVSQPSSQKLAFEIEKPARKKLLASQRICINQRPICKVCESDFGFYQLKAARKRF